MTLGAHFSCSRWDGDENGEEVVISRVVVLKKEKIAFGYRIVGTG